MRIHSTKRQSRCCAPLLPRIIALCWANQHRARAERRRRARFPLPGHRRSIAALVVTPPVNTSSFVPRSTRCTLNC